MVRQALAVGSDRIGEAAALPTFGAQGDDDGIPVVVVGVDPSQIEGEGSHASLDAIAYAAELAHRHGTGIVAVWVRPSIAISDTFVDTLAQIVDQREARADEIRHRIAMAAERLGITPVSVMVRDGDPFEELTAVAEELRAQSIIVGASDHRIGSVATRLIHHARWPVTVVP